MSFEEHVHELCRTAFCHIRNISRIRPCLSIDSTKTLVHALVTSRLDHCNCFSMAYLIILFKVYNMLWTRRLKWSLASESLIMSHHYLLSYTGSPSVSVLFLRSYCTPYRHFMVRLQRTLLSSPVLMFLGELLGLLNNFYWSRQRTSSNWLAWGPSQCARLTSGTRFHLRSKAAHLSLSLKLSLRTTFCKYHG